MSFVPDFVWMIRNEKVQFSGTSHAPFCMTISVRFTTIGLLTVVLIHICTKGSLSSGSIKLFRTVPSALLCLMCMNGLNESFGDNARGTGNGAGHLFLAF